ncbi:MAG: hypothetical protein GYA47_12770 [Desulfovibrio sp.]|nr:hypothetical protein [Desulfovibrio sp.]
MDEHVYFDCRGLHAKISVEACRENRRRPISSAFDRAAVRPPQCIRCQQWREVDPPEDPHADRPGSPVDHPTQVTGGAGTGQEFEEENIFHIPLDEGDDDDGRVVRPLPPVGKPRRYVTVEAGCPCMTCSLFKPLPTFVDGVQAVRLCWSSDPRWDFTCRRG